MLANHYIVQYDIFTIISFCLMAKEIFSPNIITLDSYLNYLNIGGTCQNIHQYIFTRKMWVNRELIEISD